MTNRMAIEHTIKIGLALNCAIATTARFARKNYFYPDMPKDYQISQYTSRCARTGARYPGARPAAGDEPGRSGSRSSGCTWKRTRASRCTSAGPPGGSMARTTRSWITTGPGSAGRDRHQAGRRHRGARARGGPGRLSELRDLLRSLGVSDVRMEKGSLRCDVNTSLAPRGAAEWGGTRTETKNVNSLRSVERAVR